jgi:hypothetical protein
VKYHKEKKLGGDEKRQHTLPLSQGRADSIIALMMEAASTSETSVDIQLRTRQYIPEDSELGSLFCLSTTRNALSNYLYGFTYRSEKFVRLARHEYDEEWDHDLAG